MSKIYPTQNKLKDLFQYNETTGEFVRKITVSGLGKAGDIAGTKNKGYLIISINNKKYSAHKLAWIYVYGECPEILDHKDSNGFNNAISNLRIATLKQNAQNRARPSTNTSGLKGVYWRNARKKWISKIESNGIRKDLGSFDCPAAAHFAYQIAADNLFGEFARSA